MSLYWENTQKYWFQVLNRQQEYVSLAAQVATHAADLMWGRGLNVISDNETDKEHLDRILEHNSMNELLYTNEMDLSLRGNTFATVELVNGLPTIVLSDPMLLSKMGRSYVDKEVAVIWKRITIDDRSFPVKEIWDREKRTHIFYNDDGKSISIDQVYKKTNIQAPPEVWYHNLGYVPVVHFKNRSGAYRMYSVADHAFAGSLEQDYNKTLRTLYDVELKNNITRLFAKLDKKDKKQLIKEAKAAGVNLAEYLEDRSSIVSTDFAGDKSGDASGNNPIQLIQGNPKFQEYWLGLQEIKAEFFETCGYSYSRPTQNGDARNTTDVVFSNAKDMMTTKGKLQVRQLQVYELMSICKDVYNKWSIGSIDGEMTIDIKSNIMADSIAEVDKNIKKVEANLESRAYAIAKMDGITLEEAEEKLAYIQQENEKYGFDENVEETLNVNESKKEA